MAGGQPRRSPAERAILAGVGVVLAVIIAIGARDLVARRPHPFPESQDPALPLFDPVPSFALTASDRAPVTNATLAGRIWVADFVFTRCTGVCPLLSGRMLALQKALRGRDDVRLVSFSVDPDYDTPEVLAAYAKDHGADSSRWIFLTGPRPELHDLIGRGFHLAVAKAPEGTAAPGELITHSDRLVLVDGKGRIRGYYRGSEEETVRRVLTDLDGLAGGS
ncbi:MAG: SCO family protein [Acidobacteria bacterium]|nr:SCO family protein [Acidobacteriota bacterium]